MRSAMFNRALAVITSTRNPKIVKVRKLGQRKHRQSQGQFLVEGLEPLRVALDAGTHPTQVFYCQDRFVGDKALALLTRLRQTGVNVIAVSQHVMQTLSARDVVLVATLPLLETSHNALSLTGRELVVVIDGLQDPVNLGRLIRTADAVGAAAIVLIEPCVDPFCPQTVRESLGSLFNVPLVRTSNVSELFTWFGQRGLCPVGASAHLGTAWGEGILKGGVALILGNETRGLSKDVSARIEQWARLPIVGKAESLNVAVAGGILMYTWLQENMGQ